jgi:toxin CcdB
MATFDCFKKKNAQGYWLDIQSELLDSLETRVVIPLEPIENGLGLVPKLNPVFTISGQPHALLTDLIGSIPVRDLGKPTGSLADHRYEILNALDFLVSGF